MASLLVTCPQCGFRTLTTHTECIHCGAALADCQSAPAKPVAESPPAPTSEPGATALEELEVPEKRPAVSSAAPDAPVDVERSTRRPLSKPAADRRPADTVWPPRMRQQFTRKPISAPKPPNVSEVGRLQAHLRGRCPRGHGALTPASLGERPAQHCPQCNGLWLETGDFAAFVRSLAQETLDLEPVVSATPAPASTAGARQLPCPVCTTPLAVRTFAGLEGCPLAQCPKHGVWIEDEEMKTLMRRIATATRDEARRLASPEGEQP